MIRTIDGKEMEISNEQAVAYDLWRGACRELDRLPVCQMSTPEAGTLKQIRDEAFADFCKATTT